MDSQNRKYFRVLSIAGSDPSGGAGIQTDIKTISALGCYAMTAITSVVDESTTSVSGVHDIPASFVVGQIKSVIDDIGVDAVKIGMLHSPDLAHAVAETLRERDIRNIVLDPVMVATSGDPLMASETIDVLKKELAPLARVITPNLPEASALLNGRTIDDIDSAKEAASDITDLGSSVLLKGGHGNGDVLIDILCNIETMERLELPQDRIQTQNTHGTGCTLSSAIAAALAKGKSLTSAVVSAKNYITGAITAGAQYQIGKGHGPVKHFWNFDNWD